MEQFYLTLLSFIIFLPAITAIVIAFLPKDKPDVVRYVTLAATVVVFATVLWMANPLGAFGTPSEKNPTGQFDISKAEMQAVVVRPWIPSFRIEYLLGLDGISFPLVVLTGLVSLLAMAASWSITKYVKGYCILYLLLVTGMLGVFMALDFFLFYVFWEVMLLPMYFLIGVWGGPRKEYAAIKFFLYTLVGSVLMLVAILLLYFNSDLRGLTPDQLVKSHAVATAEDAAAIHTSTTPVHTFNILALQAIGQTTEQFSRSLQWWAFVLLFIGFAIKVPSVPLHTWLPDAHVEAPTPISMILAGVLLKMGGYGIIRICYPICPHGGFDLAWTVCLIGVVSMVYGAFAALAQKDFKRMVAYSSVSHMGYVVLGLGVWSAVAGWQYDPDYWNMGVKGAMFQMIAHGISSSGMFFMVGVVYDRVHHRNLDEFGGLWGRMPLYTALSIGIFFAGLGLPGLCGFIGEVLVVLSAFRFSPVLAIISSAVVILTAAYILWAIQRVYLGAEYKGPHGEDLTPMKPREIAIAVPLFVLAIVCGVFPQETILNYMDKTVNAQVQTLADWTKRQDVGAAEAAAVTKAAATPVAAGAE